MPPDLNSTDPDQMATGLADFLGITFEELSGDRAVATMPVTERHHQPLGYLHGGASVVLAETVASAGATAGVLPERVAFGLEINANHVRPVQEGTLRAVGERLYGGRTTQVWEVRIFTEDEKLVCASRCTLAIVSASGRE